MYTGKIWRIMWAVTYLASLKVDCVQLLSNKGLAVIGNQYYRFFTGLLVHVNFFHFILNAIALYWVLDALKGKINDIKLLIYTIAAGSLTNVIFSMLYPNSQSIGGSPIIFALIALIAAFQVFEKDLRGFIRKTVGGKWIAGYAILSNIPVFSKNISTLVVHLAAFFVGLILGLLWCGAAKNLAGNTAASKNNCP